MAYKIDPVLKEIEKVGDVLDFLRSLNGGDSLVNYPDVAIKCKALFTRIGALDDFEVTDTKQLITTLENLPADTLEEDLLEINKNEPTESAELKSKSFNKAEIDELIALEEQHNAKTIEDTAKGIEKENSPILKRQTTRDIINQLYRLKEEADILSKMGIVEPEAVKEILSVEAEIRDTNSGLNEEGVREVAKKAVEISRATNNVETAGKMLVEVFEENGIVADSVRKEIAEVVEVMVAKEVTAKFEAALVEQTVENLVEGKGFEPREVEKIRRTITESVHNGILKPNDNIVEPNIQVVADITVKGGMRVNAPPTLANKLIESSPRLNGSEVKQAVEAVADGVENLYSPKRKSVTNAKELTSREAIEAYRKSIVKSSVMAAVVAKGESVAIAKAEAQTAVEMLFAPEETGQSATAKVGQEAKFQGNVVRNFLTSAKTVKENIEAGKSLVEKAGAVKEVKAIGKVVSVIEKTPGMQGVMEMVRKGVALNNRLSALPGQAFSQIGRLLKIESLEGFGSSLLTKFGGSFGAEIASQIGALGLEKGLWNALTLLVKTGKVGMYTAKAVATTAEVGAVTTAAGATAATGVGIPLALILLAADAIKIVGTALIDFAKNKIEGLLKSVNIDTSKTKNWLQENFGKGVGGAMNFGLNATMVLLAIPAFFGAAFAANMVLVSVLIPLVFGGIWGIQGGFTNQVSSLIPNQGPVGSGVCVNTGPVAAAGAGGAINCDTTVPNQSGTSVDKANFVRVAESWRSGGGKNAEACFNDVVKMANDAGINADYALWAWLHESGASNYSAFSNVSDFGVTYATKNDFKAQITAFLKLDPASACIGTPLIGDDYWLAFATNFLLGTSAGCYPDQDLGGVTGRTYKAEIEATWGWITSSPMPSSIHSSSSGGGGGAPSPDLTNIEDNGSQMVCEKQKGSTGTSAGNIALPTLDPNITIPEGCPNGWPVRGPITQGPYAKGCSHANMPNAVDFGVVDGTPIAVTHDGIARVGANSIYGNFVDVTGKCGGTTFTTRYAHMPNGGPKVQNNQVVHSGQIIGVVNNSGSSTGSHLHYDFRSISGGAIPDISNTLPGLKHSLTGCCNGDNGIMCE